MPRSGYIDVPSSSIWVRAALSLIALLLPLVGSNLSAQAQIPSASAPQAQSGGRDVPSRTVPVPDTVSPQMQAVIARQFDSGFTLVPQSTEEWRARVDRVAHATTAGLPALREALGVTSQSENIGGVKVHILTPAAIPVRNRNRVLINLHGGVRVFGPGESGTREAILMAGLGGFKVISVDYRIRLTSPSQQQSMTRLRSIEPFSRLLSRNTSASSEHQQAVV